MIRTPRFTLVLTNGRTTHTSTKRLDVPSVEQPFAASLPIVAIITSLTYTIP